jgi:hypothetical protein
MTIGRRRLLRALAPAAALPLPAAETPAVAARMMGAELSAERLRALAPVLERRRAQLERLRALAIDDAVMPFPVEID